MAAAPHQGLVKSLCDGGKTSTRHFNNNKSELLTEGRPRLFFLSELLTSELKSAEKKRKMLWNLNPTFRLQYRKNFLFKRNSPLPTTPRMQCGRGSEFKEYK